MSLEEIIQKAIIQNRAPIGFDEFMALALYQPALGYYRAGGEKFGERGDFITAPETSDLFGFCLARQCAQILNGDNDILEFGAGSGVLAAQLLFELGRLDALPKTYYILELSGELKARQKSTLEKTLPELLARVVWLDAMPSDFSGVVIANEVLDAMPAKRLICKNNQFFELGVDFQAGEFCWQAFKTPYQNPTAPLPKNVCEDYTTETNPQAMAWVAALSAALDSALVLLIDYGVARAEYFHPQRFDGTLRCYYRHAASDNPFVNVGAQDITTSVNFSDISDSAFDNSFTIAGYSTQALFLISLGIENYLTTETDEKIRINLAQQVKQLVLPSAMGESFKVLALAKNLPQKMLENLRGFTQQDLRHKL